MFRAMRRCKQQISQEECVEILKSEPRGVLSVLGDDGYPYGLPLTHWYDEESGKIYFHGAKEGHKIDALKHCDKASFCVYDQGYREGDDWPLHIRSVITFGRIRFIEDPAQIAKMCTSLCHKFTQDEAYIQDELDNYASRVLCLELTPEHITGKLVKES